MTWTELPSQAKHHGYDLKMIQLTVFRYVISSTTILKLQKKKITFRVDTNKDHEIKI